MKRVFILASLALFLTSFTVSATTITYSASLFADPNTGLLTGFLVVPQFNLTDPSVTLNKVTVSFTLGWNNGSAFVQNNLATYTTFFITDEINGSLTGGPTAGIDFHQVLVDNPSVPIGPNGTVTFGPFSGTQLFTALVSSPFSGFVGPGNVVYDVSGSNDFNAGCFGSGHQNCNVSGSVDFYGTLEVTYDFDTPEPATMTFAGLGLLALGFFGRRFVRR